MNRFKLSIAIIFLLLPLAIYSQQEECATSLDCDDGNSCTINSCEKGHCVLLFKTNGTSCDDGIYCNGEDICNGKGECLHLGDPCPNAFNVSPCNNICNEQKKNCFNPRGGTCYSKGQCTKGMCNGDGECLMISLEGQSCFVNSCVFGATCNGDNQCLGTHNCTCSNHSDCDDGNPCTTDFCDITTNTCSNIEAKDGTLCDDGFFCNGKDYCQSGRCSIHQGSVCREEEKCLELESTCIPLPRILSGQMLREQEELVAKGDADIQGNSTEALERSNENAINKINIGIIIGPVLATVLFVGLVTLVIFLVYRYRSSRNASLKNDPRFADYDSSSNSERDHMDQPVASISTPKLSHVGQKRMSGIPEGFVPKRNANFVSESPKAGQTSFSSSPAISAGVVIESPHTTPHIIRRPSNPMPVKKVDTEVLKEKGDNEIENVEIKKMIGSGSFGDVYLATWTQLDTITREKKVIEMAIKKLKNAENYAAFQREADTLRSLDHPNIVRYHGIFMDDINIYMATEYVPNGSVLDVLQIMKSKFLSEEHILEMVMGAAKGMEYLEGLKIVHRDLSCRNLLVHFDEDGHYNVKVSDFGMSKLVSDTTYYIASDDFVPVRWAAPEVLEIKRFSSKSDCWSFGICVWEMFEWGKEPYTHLSSKIVVDSVLSGERLSRPKSCPMDVYHIMNRCWSTKPEKRPTFKEIVIYLEFLSTNRQNINSIRSPKLNIDRFSSVASENEREPSLFTNSIPQPKNETDSMEYSDEGNEFSEDDERLYNNNKTVDEDDDRDKALTIK
eukprot:TRINITY_DN9013_c0_g1_i1.p1 TRINITY_DN9013_c0_g1~~TRINITY_DN9013_c0_g1_i1.p1  ORF type:complete len:786 (+),score=139.32 TRINITY_DN9013_c0_g1_i1:122-2479(+)